MKFYEETLNEKLIYEGNYLTITNVDVKLPNGSLGNRDIIKHPGACAIIPFLDENTVVLVEQFRKALNKTLIEIPAGKLDKGEDISVCARRELEEETGYRANNIEYLGTIATVPGFCDELIHLYKATGLTLGDKNCDEDEFTEVKIVSLDEMKAMVKRGDIIDTKTISILAYL